uniref:Uncharacterized protein n=1 Tax=Anguilla anguilla TaxID=7936 RepID=A0A0E9WSJ9_ANGAN
MPRHHHIRMTQTRSSPVRKMHRRNKLCFQSVILQTGNNQLIKQAWRVGRWAVL